MFLSYYNILHVGVDNNQDGFEIDGSLLSFSMCVKKIKVNINILNNFIQIKKDRN